MERPRAAWPAGATVGVALVRSAPRRCGDALSPRRAAGRVWAVIHFARSGTSSEAPPPALLVPPANAGAESLPLAANPIVTKADFLCPRDQAYEASPPDPRAGSVAAPVAHSARAGAAAAGARHRPGKSRGEGARAGDVGRRHRSPAVRRRARRAGGWGQRRDDLPRRPGRSGAGGALRPMLQRVRAQLRARRRDHLCCAPRR